MAILGKDSLFEASAGVSSAAHTPSGAGATGGAWTSVSSSTNALVSQAGGGFVGPSGTPFVFIGQLANATSLGNTVTLVLDTINVTDNTGVMMFTADRYGLDSIPNGYVLHLGGSGQWYFEKVLGGTFASMGTVVGGPTVVNGTPNTLAITRVINSSTSVTLTAFINNLTTPLVTYTDNVANVGDNFAGSMIGGIYHQGSAVVALSNFEHDSTAPSNTLTFSPTTLPESHLAAPLTVTGTNIVLPITVSGGTGASMEGASLTSTSAGNICAISGQSTGTLTFTDSNGNSGIITVTTGTAVWIAPNNANITPTGRWLVTGTLAQAIETGSSFPFAYENGDTIKLGFSMGNPGKAAYSSTVTGIPWGPSIYSVIDGVGLRSEISITAPTITLTPQFTSTTTPASFAHSGSWMTEGVYDGTDASGQQGSIDQNSLQQGACRFLGYEFTAGTTIINTPVNPFQAECNGDSVTGGTRMLYTGSGASNQHQMAGHLSWPQLMCQMLGCGCIQKGDGGTGITVSGSGGMPQAVNMVNFLWNGQAYTPAIQPELIVNWYGINDGGDESTYIAEYPAFLAAQKARSPKALILNGVSFAGGAKIVDLAAIVTAYNDPTVGYVDASAFYVLADTTDGVAHAGTGGHAKAAHGFAIAARALMVANGWAMQAAGSGSHPRGIRTGVTF